MTNSNNHNSNYEPSSKNLFYQIYCRVRVSLTPTQNNYRNLQCERPEVTCTLISVSRMSSFFKIRNILLLTLIKSNTNIPFDLGSKVIFDLNTWHHFYVISSLRQRQFTARDMRPICTIIRLPEDFVNKWNVLIRTLIPALIPTLTQSLHLKLWVKGHVLVLRHGVLCMSIRVSDGTFMEIWPSSSWRTTIYDHHLINTCNTSHRSEQF